MHKNITTIDITASGIRLVVGYYENKSVVVKKALTGEPLPLDSSLNIDVSKAQSSLIRLLNECKKDGLDNGLFVPIYQPEGLKIISDLEGTSYNSVEKELIPDTYNNCIGQIQGKAKKDTSRFVTCVPYLFQIDDDGKITSSDHSFELGTKSDSLTMYADCFLIDQDAYKRYEEILHAAITPRYYFELVSPLGLVYLINNMLDGNQRKVKNYIAINFEKDVTYVIYVSEKRMRACGFLPIGYLNCVEEASRKLNITTEKGEELTKMFGLESEIPLSNVLPDNISFEAWHQALSSSFSTLLDSINSIIKAFSLPDDTVILETGSGSEILLLSKALKEVTNSQVTKFQPSIIGARDMGYLSCLGAIMMSSEGYLENQSSALRHQKDSTIQYDKFGRN